MQKPVALVTGAGRGIGRAIAEQLAELNYDLVIDDIFKEQDITDTLQSIKDKGADVLYVQADISQTADRKRLVDAGKEKYNRLDVLVNNAGVAPRVRMDILEATEESYDRVMNINLRGPYFLTQLVANWMIEQQQSAPERQFKIINTASMSSYTSSPARGEYCLSKAGVSMMTRLYADRLAEYGILVYEIRPGIIATDMTATVQEKYNKLIAGGVLPIKRWGQPQDIAKAVAGIVLGYFPYSTGQVFEVDGGFHIPRL
ncbi:MAG TPA: 3-ketoacyl-ACP reductase [bacterium]|nr:3-ketoacyl-ACP reductase [bacterium]HPN46278.1 3-ketoacyl-ACP reductase [bacterium]